MSDRTSNLPNHHLPFPRKLWDMINSEPDELICWSPDGDSFVIRDQPTFCADVLPRHFRHNNLTSLQRQLNLYGFSRRSRANEAGAYLHPLFKRDQPRNLDRIKRKPKGKNADCDSSPPPAVLPEPEVLVKKIEQAEAAKVEAALQQQQAAAAATAKKKKKKRSPSKAKPRPLKAKRAFEAAASGAALVSTSPTTACAFPESRFAAESRECDVGAVAFDALHIATDEEDGGATDEELLEYDPPLDPDEELIDPELVWSPDGGMPPRPGQVDLDVVVPEPPPSAGHTGWAWPGHPGDPDPAAVVPEVHLLPSDAPLPIALPPMPPPESHDSDPWSARFQLKRQLSCSAPEGRSARSLAQLLHTRQQHFGGVAGDPAQLSPGSPAAHHLLFGVSVPSLPRGESADSDLGLTGPTDMWRRGSLSPSRGGGAAESPRRMGKAGGDAWDPQEAMLGRRAGSRTASQMSTSSLDWNLDQSFESIDMSRAFDCDRTLFQLEH